jgi:hypothetical protein
MACPEATSARRPSSSSGRPRVTITRLTAQWQDDAEAFTKRSLKDIDYVYVWVDGIVRPEALCDRAGVEDPRRPVVVATG